jgi:hypothetical protein
MAGTDLEKEAGHGNPGLIPWSSAGRSLIATGDSTRRH